MRDLSGRLGWDVKLLQEKVREIVANSLSYVPLFLTIQIKKLDSKGDTIIVEGRYRYFLDEGKFHVVLNRSTLEVVSMEIG